MPQIVKKLTLSLPFFLLHLRLVGFFLASVFSTFTGFSTVGAIGSAAFSTGRGLGSATRASADGGASPIGGVAVISTPSSTG